IAHFVNLVRDLFEVRLPYHNANQFVSTEFESIALDLFCRPSLIGERIERKVKVESWELRVGRFPNVFNQGFGHWNLMRTIFSERNADGITNSISQQRADSDRAFDARIFTFAGLGYSEMQRIIPIRAQLV